MENIINDECLPSKSIKIYTLNCWGLRYMSQHRELRIKSIAKYLNESDYDIVFLQEIWCNDDYEHIRETTKSKFCFSHMFKNPSILGTSGLAILLSWTPNVVYFEPFSVNGSPFRPWHGDWFAFKGVGYARVDFKHLSLHLFCTHMHAQYSKDESISDQYFVHRVCQSYQMSRFINLMTHNSKGSKSSNNLIVLAGDLNTAHNELPYQLLVAMTDLNDCYHHVTCEKQSTIDDYSKGDIRMDSGKISNDNDKNNDKKELNNLDDINLITSGHQNNSFTSMISNVPNSFDCKRIDYIMYQLISKQKNINLKNKNEFRTNEDLIDKRCSVERVKCGHKDPVTGISFSDHMPVAAKINITFDTTIKKLKICSSCKESFTFSYEFSKETSVKSMINGDGDAASGDNSKSFVQLDMSAACTGDGMISINELHDSDESVSDENIEFIPQKTKYKSLLSEVTDSGFKISKCGPLQLKQIASNAVFKSNSMKSQSPKLSMLEYVNSILYKYLQNNQQSMKLSVFMFIFIFLLMIAFSIIATIFSIASFITLFLAVLTTFGIGSIIITLLNLHYRCEQHAVKAIINDINCEIQLSK